MRRALLISALSAFLGYVPVGLAQTYPEKPVRVLVGFAPGGPADVIGRLVAQGLSALWGGQSVFVENRPGASGAIAVRALTSASKDGYTLLFTSNSQLVYQVMNKSAGYDMTRDLQAVIKVAATPNIIVAANELGAKSLKDVLDLAKSKKLNFGTAGTGSTPHLTLAYLFNGLAGVDIQHVPYAGGGPALTAVVGNQLDLAGVALTPALPMVKNGRAVGIAVTSPKRLPALPDVPTVAEQGFPGFEDDTWIGMFVAAGTPEPVVKQLNAAVQKLLETPAFKERLAGLGFEPNGGSHAQFQRFVVDDLQKWSTYMKSAGIKPE